MSNFEKITESSKSLADFRRTIPKIETPWGNAFHRLWLLHVYGGRLRRLPQPGAEYYLVEGSIENVELTDKAGNIGQVSVGMQAEAKIVIQKKTIIRYLLEKINLF